MSIWSTVEEMYEIKIRDTARIKDVYRVRTSSKDYCLKRYDHPEDEVQFIANVLSFLEEREYERGQKLYRAVDEASYISHNGVPYTLTNWVDGQRPNLASRHELKKAIRSLAKFHKVAEGFPISEVPSSRIRYSMLDDEVSRYKKTFSRYETTEPLTLLCEEVLEQLHTPRVKNAIYLEDQACSIVHGDYNYPNLIMDRRGSLHLIDFENTSLHVRMEDLSHILHRNCLWNASEMLRWIEYYDKHRPLRSSDKSLLHALLTAPYHVYRNIKIGGIRYASSVIPSSSRLRHYRRDLAELE